MRSKYSSARRTDEVEQIRRLVNLAPKDTDLRIRLVSALIDRLRYQEALNEVQTVIRIDPNNLAARQLRHRIVERQPMPG